MVRPTGAIICGVDVGGLPIPSVAGTAGPRFVGPTLVADSFEVTLAFYRNTLGLPVRGEKPYAECAAEGCRFTIVDARLWSQANEMERPIVRGAARPPELVLAIRVPDVDATVERLMASEVRFLAPPTDRPSLAARNAFLRDPDGRVIEISSPLRRTAP